MANGMPVQQMTHPQQMMPNMPFMGMQGQQQPASFSSTLWNAGNTRSRWRMFTADDAAAATMAARAGLWSDEHRQCTSSCTLPIHQYPVQHETARPGGSEVVIRRTYRGRRGVRMRIPCLASCVPLISQDAFTTPFRVGDYAPENWYGNVGNQLTVPAYFEQPEYELGSLPMAAQDLSFSMPTMCVCRTHRQHTRADRTFQPR